MSPTEEATSEFFDQSASGLEDETDVPSAHSPVRQVAGGGYTVVGSGRTRYFPPSEREPTEHTDRQQERQSETMSPLSSGAKGGESFSVLAQWEGVVTDVDDDGTLWVRLSPGSSQPEEVSDFSVEEVPPSDRPLVEPGAVFYWTIAYHDHPDGQRTRESSIRFRRLPARRQADLDQAKEWAYETMRRFGLDSGDGQSEAR